MQVEYVSMPRVIAAPRRPQRSWLEVAHTGYRMAMERSSTADWITAVARDLHGVLDQGLGIAAVAFSMKEGLLTFDAGAFVGVSPKIIGAMGRLNAALSPSDVIFQFASGTVRLLSSVGARTVTELVARPDIKIAAEVGIADKLTVRVDNPDDAGRVGVSFEVFLPVISKLERRKHTILERLSAHLGSAWRLRTALHEETTTEAEAVFDVRGRLLHLEGEAQGARSRSHLSDSIEHFRCSQRKEHRPDEVLALWQALVDGRWSIVAHTDNDGKKLLLARRNEPRSRAWPKLSPRERHVAAYSALGHPTKLIAYELGIAPSTASSLLWRAIRKLGLRSREELVETFGAGPVSTGHVR